MNHQLLTEVNVWSKLHRLEDCCEGLLEGDRIDIPETPGRDAEVWAIRDLPPKKGLSFREGQARLVHDLASIELQAMELGLRTLSEYPEAPRAFREELVAVTLEEGAHLRLCLKALENLGLPWGSFPVHVGLWQSVASSDEFLDRILIVHRYLEGSGLDASETLLRRLSGVNAKESYEAVQVIARDEVAHVQFGSKWFHRICEERKLDSDREFRDRLLRLFMRIPRRLEKVQEDLRKQAGFTDGEIETLKSLRERWLTSEERIHVR